MGLFGLGDPKKETRQDALARQARVDQSVRNLEQGGLPVSANERLQKLKHETNPLFTTDLSVNEFLLVRASGYEPVAQVMGSSIYHMGWQFTPNWSSGELGMLTHAHWHARILAIQRLQKEAAMLGAHGVVGVRIDQNKYDWGSNLIEFSLMGTAIRLKGEPPVQFPFISDLSGEEFWKLKQAGFYPVGFAFGNCVWYEIASWNTMMATGGTGGFLSNTSWYNQELTDFTRAIYTARHLCMQRLVAECNQMGASGVVGTKLDMNVTPFDVDIGNDQHRTDLMAGLTALGTAIVESDTGSPFQIDYGTLLSDTAPAEPDEATISSEMPFVPTLA